MKSQVAELLALTLFPPRACGKFPSDATFMLHSVVDTSKLVYGPGATDFRL